MEVIPSEVLPTTIFWAFGDSEPSPSDLLMMSATTASLILSASASATRISDDSITLSSTFATAPTGTAVADASSSSVPAVGKSLPHDSANRDRRAAILHVLSFLGLTGMGVLLVAIMCSLMAKSKKFDWGTRKQFSDFLPAGGCRISEKSAGYEITRTRKPTWSARLSANIGLPFHNFRANGRRYDEKGIEKTPHYLPSHVALSNKTVAFEDQVLNIASMGRGIEVGSLTASSGASDLPALTYRIATPSPVYHPGRARTVNGSMAPSTTAKHLSLSATTNSNTSSFVSASSSEEETRPLVELIRATPANKVMITDCDDAFRPSSFMPTAKIEPLRPKSARSITFAPGTFSQRSASTVSQRKSGKSVKSIQSTASSEWDIARAYRYDQSRSGASAISGISTVSGISGMSRISEGEGTEFESRIMAMRGDRNSC